VWGGILALLQNYVTRRGSIILNLASTSTSTSTSTTLLDDYEQATKFAVQVASSDTGISNPFLHVWPFSLPTIRISSTVRNE
jgi:hypothetical protein